MSLSNNERKQLAEMERQVSTGDPVFARKFRAARPGLSAIAPGWSGLLLLLTGVLVIVVGIVTQLPLIGIIGFLLIVIGMFTSWPTKNSHEQPRD
ncbi:MAG: DUF3040 domain-containing protein [Actinomycetota bacterium]